MRYLIYLQESINHPVEIIEDMYASVESAHKWLIERSKTKPFHLGEIVSEEGVLIWSMRSYARMDISGGIL